MRFRLLKDSLELTKNSAQHAKGLTKKRPVDRIERELYSMRAWMFGIHQEMFRREVVKAHPTKSIDVLEVYGDARPLELQGP
ncbi:hypothetical protein Tco_0949683, partial [Tanacetum coccineum]